MEPHDEKKKQLFKVVIKIQSIVFSFLAEAVIITFSNTIKINL